MTTLITRYDNNSTINTEWSLITASNAVGGTGGIGSDAKIQVTLEGISLTPSTDTFLLQIYAMLGGASRVVYYKAIDSTTGVFTTPLIYVPGAGGTFNVTLKKTGGTSRQFFSSVFAEGASIVIDANVVTWGADQWLVPPLSNDEDPIPASVRSIDDGVITSAKFAANAIDASAIADNAIDAGSIASGAITSAKFAAGAIDSTALASGAITSAKFAAGAIDATAIADNAIDAGAIASGAITSAKFAAGAIDASAIADNAIDAGAIASGAITSAKFASGAINATVIADGAIDAATFAAGAIDAAAIADNAIDAGAIAAGAITSAKFAAGAIAAASIATDVFSTIVDGVWSKVLAGTLTAEQIMRGLAATVFGKLHISGSSRIYRDPGDTKDVVTATVSAAGRDTVTLDLS